MSKLGGIETSPEQSRLPAGAPLFLVGAPRSGTSLVYRALGLNPAATYISNWLRRKPRWVALSVLNRIPRRLPGLQAKYWFGPESNAYRYGGARPLLERLFPAPVEGAPLFQAFGVGGGAQPPSRQDVASLRSAFAGLTRFGGGSTVVSKCIANNRHISILAQVFPEARFVSIVRDGRAVAYSLSRVDWWEGGTIWWFGGTPLQWRERGGDPWELCARAWVEEVRAVETGLHSVTPSQVLRVTYEELVAQPVEQLASMARFGNLPQSKPWTEALRRLEFPNRNELWRLSLDADLIERIETVQAEELRRYGYL